MRCGRADTSIHQVEQLKKKKGKTAGATKDDAKDDVAEAATTQTAAPPEDGSANGDDQPASPSQAAPSLAQQSKLRSTSFRKGSISISGGPLSPGPFSPDGDTAPDIYRKQVTRIEELERENKRLAKEAADAEKRWQKSEEDLADLRETDGDATGKKGDGLVEKLVRGLVSPMD